MASYLKIMTLYYSQHSRPPKKELAKLNSDYFGVCCYCQWKEISSDEHKDLLKLCVVTRFESYTQSEVRDICFRDAELLSALFHSWRSEMVLFLFMSNGYHFF